MLKAHVLNDRICAHFNNAAHVMEVPPNARLLFCNGQVGARPDGSVPEDKGEQLGVIFERIGEILSAADMTFSDIVRLTVYYTDHAILEPYNRIHQRVMGDHNPPAILLIVEGFPRLGVAVEIEAIAAKAG
ncbi:MAG: RidA family protein [Hyphomicrobiaceae bacterium]